jgi:hypothetical protein
MRTAPPRMRLVRRAEETTSTPWITTFPSGRRAIVDLPHLNINSSSQAMTSRRRLIVRSSGGPASACVPRLLSTPRITASRAAPTRQIRTSEPTDVGPISTTLRARQERGRSFDRATHSSPSGPSATSFTISVRTATVADRPGRDAARTTRDLSTGLLTS